jgi:hypothetical protein
LDDEITTLKEQVSTLQNQVQQLIDLLNILNTSSP